MLTVIVAHTFAFVLLDVAIIVLIARLFGRVARALRQPAVIGEIVAGIMLGPTLLATIPLPFDDSSGKPNNLFEFLFPPDVTGSLKTLGNLGLVLFMFIVGMELDLALIRGRARRAGTISLLSIVLPFSFGALLALVLYPLHGEVDGDTVKPVAFTLFLGVAMSITAFPVLARILTERRMHRTGLGVLALASAAVDDILAWTLLAFVVAVAKGTGAGAVVQIVALSALFVAVMFLVVRPLLARLLQWYKNAGRVTPDMLAVVLVGLVLSALATEAIGIHFFFGAFVFGAVMPRQGAHEFTREILERLEQVSVLLLLPIFFVVAGFNVNLREFRDPALLWQLGLILAAAIGGKFIGAFAGARIQRMPTQQSAAIAILMNTRGLTELIVLIIGREVGVLNTPMFTMLVVMALVTTVMTEPLLRIVYPDRAVQRDIDTATKAALGPEQIYRVLVVADGVPNAATERMVRLAGVALAHRPSAEVLLSRFLETRKGEAELELGAGILPDLAGLAEAVEGLEAFASSTTATTAPVRVLCRFSTGTGQDLVHQIATSGAEVVVLSEEWIRKHPAPYAAIDAVTLLVVPAELPSVWIATGTEAALAVADDAVYVRDDGTEDGARAVVLATQAAAHSGRSLVMIAPDGDGKTRRRLQHAVEPLQSTSTQVTIASAADVNADDGSDISTVTAAARVVDRIGGSALNLRDVVTQIVEGVGQKS